MWLRVHSPSQLSATAPTKPFSTQQLRISLWYVTLSSHSSFSHLHSAWRSVPRAEYVAASASQHLRLRRTSVLTSTQLICYSLHHILTWYWSATVQNSVSDLNSKIDNGPPGTSGFVGANYYVPTLMTCQWCLSHSCYREHILSSCSWQVRECVTECSLPIAIRWMCIFPIHC